MNTKMFDAKRVDNYLKSVEKAGASFKSSDELLVGVDLGTAYIVVVVLNKKGEAVACESEFSRCIKDGVLVDYLGAVNTVKRLKKKIEENIGANLTKAATAIPPGTPKETCKSHQYVVESCEMDVVNMVEEPTAANNVLQITDGVIVDIGGGTTGLSVLSDGKVIYTADEPTGGTHISLVLAGNYHITFDEAETLKKDSSKEKEVIQIVRPVIQKMSTIVAKHIEKFPVQNIYLVGGTCCLKGVEDVFTKELGIKTYKPKNPFLVTPVGIALSAR